MRMQSSHTARDHPGGAPRAIGFRQSCYRLAGIRAFTFSRTYFRLRRP
jgi:hypothetical protein